MHGLESLSGYHEVQTLTDAILWLKLTFLDTIIFSFPFFTTISPFNFSEVTQELWYVYIS